MEPKTNILRGRKTRCLLIIPEDLGFPKSALAILDEIKEFFIGLQFASYRIDSVRVFRWNAELITLCD